MCAEDSTNQVVCEVGKFLIAAIMGALQLINHSVQMLCSVWSRGKYAIARVPKHCCIKFGLGQILCYCSCT